MKKVIFGFLIMISIFASSSKVEADVQTCYCTAPFQRGWPYTGWWRFCNETDGDHDQWAERADCQTCFESNGCGLAN